MIDVALLSVIRRWRLRDGMAIREIARRTGLSRNTVRKYLDSGVIDPKYPERKSQSKLDDFAEKLSGWLKTESKKGRKQKRSLRQIHSDLCALGFTLLTSVVLYIVIPVVLAQWLRKSLLAKGTAAFDATMAKIGPWSITALLATLVLLFAFQGEAILKQPLVIGLLAVPILIQVFFNSALAYWLNRAVGEKHNIACPSALIGASNFFELAVAAAISLFGFNSGAALATVVGVLIEVPVMLLVVYIVNNSKGWYERA